jgi:hypothetical protein
MPAQLSNAFALTHKLDFSKAKSLALGQVTRKIRWSNWFADKFHQRLREP